MNARTEYATTSILVAASTVAAPPTAAPPDGKGWTLAGIATRDETSYGEPMSIDFGFGGTGVSWPHSTAMVRFFFAWARTVTE